MQFAKQLGGIMGDNLNALNQAIYQLVDQANSLEELQDLLADTSLSLDDVTELMAQAFAVSELAGRVDVDSEANE